MKLLESMEERWGRDGTERAMRGEEMEGIRELLKEVKLSINYDAGKDKDE